MKIKLLVIASFFLLGTMAVAQTPTIKWKKCLGGTNAEGTDVGATIIATSDGGTIIASSSESNDGDVSGNKGETDAWIVKQDVNGNVVWKKSFGGSGSEATTSVKQTADDGYIISGFTASGDGDFNGGSVFGYLDAFVCKLNKNGNIEWLKTYMDSIPSDFYDVIQTPDGGYLAVGDVRSKAFTSSDEDVLLIKMDSNGNTQWVKTYGGSQDETGNIVRQAATGYIIGSHSESNDGDVSQNKGSQDIWIIKTDINGQLEWQKSYGGAMSDGASDINVLNDGYAILGRTQSSDGDVTNYHGDEDTWIIRTGLTGDIKWQKCYGGSQEDFSTSMISMPGKNFVIGGGSASIDGDLQNAPVTSYNWIFSIDSAGNLNSSTRYFGGGSVGLCKTTSDEFVSVSGIDSSFNQPDYHGGDNDLFVEKIAELTGISNLLNNDKVSLGPNPMADNLHISITAEQSKSYTIEIFNALGQKVIQQQNERPVFDVDTAELPLGVYTYTITTVNGIISKGKLVK